MPTTPTDIIRASLESEWDNGYDPDVIRVAPLFYKLLHAEFDELARVGQAPDFDEGMVVYGCRVEPDDDLSVLEVDRDD